MGKKYIDNKSNKENLKEKDNNIKKSNSLPQTFDIASIKKNIINEMYTITSNEIESFTNNLPLSNSIHFDENNTNADYINQYQNYLTEEFNSRCVYLIISFMNQSKDFPEEYIKELNFPKKIITIIKNLMMNEFEISIFTLCIDKYGWSNSELDYENYLLFLGIYTKRLTMNKENFQILKNKFELEKKDFFQNFENWEKKIQIYVPTVIEINERFKFLNKPTNTFCKKNFIDFNVIVDQIAELSPNYTSSENKDKKVKVKIREVSGLDELENPVKNINNSNISNSNEIDNFMLNKRNSENRNLNLDVSPIPNINSNIRNQKEINLFLSKQESNNMSNFKSILSFNSRISDDDYDNNNLSLINNKNSSFINQKLFNRDESHNFLESMNRNNIIDLKESNLFFNNNSFLKTSKIFYEGEDQLNKKEGKKNQKKK